MEVTTKSYLSEQANAIRFEYTQAAQNIVSIGQRLMEVQDRLEYGEFMRWVNSEFGWSKSQAYRFMDTAKNFLDFPTLGSFDKSALYLLAAPSTPEAARDEAKKIAANGRVSHKEAKRIVSKYRATPVTEPEWEAPVSLSVGTAGAVRTFDEAWAVLKKYQQNQINALPGSMSALRAFYNAAVGDG